MTTDDIIRMAKEAGLCDADGKDSDSIVITSHLEQFANLVAAAEREACAKVCDYISQTHLQKESHTTSVWASRECADAIRARGQG